MKQLEWMLFNYLRTSQVKIDITGFDMDAFSAAMHRELSRRLEMIEYIAFEEDAIMPPDEKITAIRRCFLRDFYEKE